MEGGVRATLLGSERTRKHWGMATYRGVCWERIESALFPPTTLHGGSEAAESQEAERDRSEIIFKLVVRLAPVPKPETEHGPWRGWWDGSRRF